MPVIINENDYALGLYNGDIGLCLNDQNGELKIFIGQEDEVRAVSPGRLPGHNLAYALTVHKSQGSEFDKVLLVLPDRASRVLTRELLYTAITRARSEVHIIGKPDVLRVGVKTRLKRASGLQDQLWLKSI
jgi:exodeoxyribonuclease V alpha subunit